MDPFTILGASASVAQFVGYAIKFFSAAREIHASTRACTSKITILDEVYRELRDLSPRLESPLQEIGQNARLLELTDTDLNRLLQHSNSINALSRVCGEDCIKLLDVIANLKGKNGRPNRWNSFGVALKTILKSNEIVELEQRLQHTQTTLTLQICAMSSTWQSIFQRSFTKLQVDNECIGSQQSKKLSTIENAIQELDNRLASIKTEQRIPSFSAADISALEKQMSLLSMASSDATKQHTILKSLHFDSRVSRYDSIHDAHKRTFSWVFKDVLDAQDKPSTGSVIRWLKYGDGIFWISGKPGSGKSTLMKFITDHDETLPALKAWSYPQPVVTAGHFFWSAGSWMQKSKQGLLQTLLFDIFRQQPDLIEVSCPERWLKSDKQLHGEPWRITELTKAIDRIVQCNNLSVRFCFFIDGLDELEGDHFEICQALRKLSTSPFMKLCVSSRPWNIFEDSFGRASSSKLYIHDLTQDDIYKYVKDSLEEHYRWDDLDVEIKNANSLIKQVTQRAAGVFLWVYLVVRELRSGLTEYDSFFDLQKRLEAIPDGLEAFFKHILESVDPFYHGMMAKTIKTALIAKSPEPTAMYGFLDLEHEDEDYAIKLPIRAATDKRVNPTHKTTCRRLNARTRGLLEVDPENHFVEFFHRSVIDYLSTDQMARYLDGKIKTKFDANLSILRAYTARIKNINPKVSDGGILNYLKLKELL
ncbi:hypothetical protein F4806DRAFT_128040 [Annulohypoxylon nitens]|nr:hypothetical protein F4806DRAFT_128040 [Annulohypoxylon nitens]